jgi:hypothetical protein
VRSSSRASEEFIRHKGWQVRSSSNTMLAGEELFKIKCRWVGSSRRARAGRLEALRKG